MLISIAIPAFNEAKYLPETITTAKRASRAFAVAGWQSEIVVCDNNSTDATAEVAKAHGARVVFEPFNQIAASRNAAGRAAEGDWLVFVDADTRVSPELFREMMRAFAAGDCIGGGAQPAPRQVHAPVHLGGNSGGVGDDQQCRSGFPDKGQHQIQHPCRAAPG